MPVARRLGSPVSAPASSYTNSGSTSRTTIDFLVVEASSNGSSWTPLSAWTGFGFTTGVEDLSGFGPNVHFRFRLVSDNTVQYDGAYIDDVEVACTTEVDGYRFSSGTSMATPHVAGVAALVLSEDPGISVSGLRSALLSTVDAKSSLSGRVATGGRLNAAAALAAVGPPNTTITDGPNGATNDATPTFSFSSSKPGSGFECSVDTADFEPCSGAAQHTSSELTEGSHTFRVRARDASDRTDPSPAQRSFTVDLTPPATQITSGPSGGQTVGRQTSFSFAATGGASGFRCQLDGGAWQACSSPRTLTGLSGGAHTFRAAAVDAAGNEDASPAEAQFTVDATSPQTTLTGKPKGRSRDRTPTIVFVADDPGAEFQCRLDARGWNSCGSPRTFRVKPGTHSLAVRATDAFANVDQTPAQTRFKVLAKR